MNSVNRRGLLVFLAIFLPGFLAPRAAGQASVLTYHNDAARTGQNLSETLLTPGNVNQTHFGKKFAQGVDGYVYAQPLYMPNVAISGKGMHNVVFVVSEHDTAYAFDADDNTGGNAMPLWVTSFLGTGITPMLSSDNGCTDLVPEIGITSTPVIDPMSETIFILAMTKVKNGNIITYHQHLHALDVTTGLERTGSPVEIMAAVAGNGDGSMNGMVSFDPFQENQRSGLALVNGQVIIAWASHCDFDPYHGWVMAYDEKTLKQTAVYNNTPNGSRGGIWQSGDAPAVDAAGNMFLETGNGTFNANKGGTEYGDTVQKLSLSGSTISVGDYFTPSNQKYLENTDLDLGSGGAMLLPDQPGAHPHLMVAYGKQGVIYLIDRDNMGHYGTRNNVVQQFNNTTSMFSTAAFWNGWMYTVGVGGKLKSFAIANGLFVTRPTALSTTVFGFTGATPSVSASGMTNGIVWALDNSGYGSGSPAVLHAYLATNVHDELYNSSQAGSRDTAGPAVKFTVPTVANGKVYVGGQKQLTVYGLF
jgi:hypothetical protein